ncbi:MAG: DUF6714 family protein [Terracidiphilus sp.]
MPKVSSLCVAMNLVKKIEMAFARRCMPTEVIEPEQYIQFDSDVEEALWFAGRDWREITSKDWQDHSDAVHFLSPEAFAYYLPSLLILTIQNPKGYPDMAVDPLIGKLDRSPSVEGWNDSFSRRFLGLSSEEYEAIKEWLLFACENIPQAFWGAAASGPGDGFGRTFDTVDLLQKETELRRMIDQEGSGIESR